MAPTPAPRTSSSPARRSSVLVTARSPRSVRNGRLAMATEAATGLRGFQARAERLAARDHPGSGAVQPTLSLRICLVGAKRVELRQARTWSALRARVNRLRLRSPGGCARPQPGHSCPHSARVKGPGVAGIWS